LIASVSPHFLVIEKDEQLKEYLTALLAPEQLMW
jgi:hypothetical protein